MTIARPNGHQRPPYLLDAATKKIIEAKVLMKLRAKKQVQQWLTAQGYRLVFFSYAEIQMLTDVWLVQHEEELRQFVATHYQS